MKIESETIQPFILKTISSFVEENDIECPEVGADTRLLGAKGIFDSMDLVSFVVFLEEALDDELSLQVSLTDEKSMSRHTSPFINLKTLSSYIIERAAEI